MEIEENPEIDPHLDRQYIFDIGVKVIQWRKYNVFNNGMGQLSIIYKKKKNFNSYLTP